MSKENNKKVMFIPNPLTKEWVAGFNAHETMSCNIWHQDGILDIFKEADDCVLKSREMEIALASHIYLYHEYNIELDKFFIENHQDTFENAMKLAFQHYLDTREKSKEEHPHFSELLELIKERKELQEFYGSCVELITEYKALEKQVNETWGKIKGVHFEKAIMAINILYLKKFLPHFNDILEQHGDILRVKDLFLRATSTYLSKTNEHWKSSIDHNLWKDELKLWEKMSYYFVSLLKDRELLNKIDIHIKAIINLQAFYHGPCISFIFDRTFKKDPYTYDKQDDDMCNLKNLVLPIYYLGRNYEKVASYIEQSKNEHPEYLETSHATNAYSYYVQIPLLMEYFGIKEQFLYNNKSYDLCELIRDKEILSGCYEHIHLKELQDFFQSNSDMSFEDILIKFSISTMVFKQKNRLPIDIRSFSELASVNGSDKDNFRLLSTDISEDKLQINLNLYNMLHYGQSDLCIVFPYIRATNEAGYLALLNRLRKRNNNKNDAEQIESTVARQFKDFPVFSDAKITTNKKFENGEIDVAIYKDKSLILIEVKSTYGIINFEERFRHEKHLIYAGHQLNKAIKALQVDAELLAEITGDNSVKFDQLKLETLIVSTSFEFDNEKFSGHRKISLLELMVCLHNDACCLINIDEIYKNLAGENIIDEAEGFEIGKKIGEELSFYNKEPTIDDFFKALNSDIWGKVLPYYQKKL
jgi:hypothetical protein